MHNHVPSPGWKEHSGLVSWVCCCSVVLHGWLWVWLHKGKACDEERGWTGASSCVWSRPTVPYHEAGHWMFLGQMWVSTFQAPLLVLGKTFCGSVGNRMIRGWMSVQFSSRWYLCTRKSPYSLYPVSQKVPQRRLWNGGLLSSFQARSSSTSFSHASVLQAIDWLCARR